MEDVGEMKAIFRKEYQNRICQALGKDTIIVLTGQRRIGKSYILRLFRDSVAGDNGNHVIFIDKEKKEFDPIRTYTQLNEYIDNHRVEGKRNFILVDEIQDIAEFERTLRSYREEPDVEIIVTGSNSCMLSSELSTVIGGRYKEIHVHSLSYREFLNFHRLADSEDSLAKYIRFGGLPGLAKTGLDEADVREYQTDVYHTVLLKDVVMRNNIRNVTFLDNLVRFLADSEGKVVSATSIAKYMKSQGEKVTPTAIINYVNALCESYAVHRVNRYDMHGKKLFENNCKYYFEDNGIRNCLVGGSRETDIEKVIENVVYAQLVRLGYAVSVGQLRAGEIDFVCQKPDGERAYVQASYIVADPATRAREFGNLRNIKDNYPKYVISMTPLVTRSDSDGITHLHLRTFLSEGLR